ncbi:FTR1 family protein [Streptomyces purpureus]|uniref:FTR1 family iron permease n=1 Tax=Streptomyces purpureus TaxID=1951 RepID=UPI000367E7E8|nr:FTR1 family protein [Streptomyces purpureus]
MYGIYLIGLRQGMAAVVVVCVLAAYLVRTGRRDALRPVRAGAGVAVGLALAFGCLLEFGSQELTVEARKLLGGSLSVLAAALTTWLVLGMRRRVPLAAWALFAAAFLAVGREGLETAQYVWASVRAAGDEAGSSGPLWMLLLGVATAVLLGVLLHRGLLRIRSVRFFTWAGGMLAVMAAGVLAYGVQGLREARLLGGPSGTAFDIGSVVPADSWYGTLLAGVFAFRPDPTVLQVWVWVLYLIPALTLLLAPVWFGRSVGVEEQKATDEKAEARDGARDGDGAGDGGDRLRDGARRAGSRTDGDGV